MNLWGNFLIAKEALEFDHNVNFAYTYHDKHDKLIDFIYADNKFHFFVKLPDSFLCSYKFLYIIFLLLRMPLRINLLS